ncbi:lactoylglutathione lyase [Gilvimarinus sp. SDUM040013]|uniref:lactoylglutathione lyase n=1 Tax=Gilvimarinus gilvus TaxID=3058038 RepID=A0ABU4S3F0_9GAMM|nr:lactoylglutathione lyase [Gilvimarinus sp. SDUM040013]MDO3386880.1 lactoylglutathione lyase [Gilvimarinus sp. SDUM040013]MDX6851464.1 lactoylglutathione lyase [Gilvimarinus sp. SDUM040013]
MDQIITPRLLHVMLRVNNMDLSIDFYTRIFGMKVLRKKDYIDGRFTLAFLGYDEESKSTVVELTHNWDEQSYEKGNAFGHLAFAVKDIFTFFGNLKKDNVKFTREPSPMKFDASETIAFISDPDGYTIELIERP